MKKLSHTWRQQKAGAPGAMAPPDKPAPHGGLAPGTISTTGGTMAADSGSGRKRFLGRIPINSAAKVPLQSANTRANQEVKVTPQATDTSFSLSFGGDFDSQFVDQLEQLEQQITAANSCKPAGPNLQVRHKENGPPNDTSQVKQLTSETETQVVNKNKTVAKSVSVNTNHSLRSRTKNKSPANNANTAKSIEAMLQRGNLDLSSLSLDSPLHVSTPAERRNVSVTNKSRTTKKLRSPHCVTAAATTATISAATPKAEKTNLFQHICLADDSDGEMLDELMKSVKTPKLTQKNSKNQAGTGTAKGNPGKRLNELSRNGGIERKSDDVEKAPAQQVKRKIDETSKRDKKKSPDKKNSPDSGHSSKPDTSIPAESAKVVPAEGRTGANKVKQDNDSITLQVDGKHNNIQVPAARPVPTSRPVPEDHLQLSAWGLPDPVLAKYAQLGISSMFEWQAQCLCTGNVLSGGNLVYSAPTSAGKTLVAELLILKRVLETRTKAIVILPFVSVVREKMFYLQALYQDAGLRVDGYMGGQSPAGGFSSLDVAVCTIEKANSLVNRLMEEGRLDTLGTLVVDELHMVGDSGRGYLLELLLTKVRYMAGRDSSATPQTDKQTGDQQAAGEQQPRPASSVQIIGMSATLPNLSLLAGWLDADLYTTSYRPVPLTEMVKLGTALYDSELKKIREVDRTWTFSGDDDHLIPLCLEVIREGHSVLIFCPTKNWCETLADSIAKEFYGLRHAKDAKEPCPVTLNTAAIQDSMEQLRRCPVGVDKLLGRAVPQGVAYHHAGLTFDERDIIEGAFRHGAVRVLVATSTLSSGVNLPARRVIIRTPVFYRAVIDALTYKQMVGRAGRKGIDTMGESILVCKPSEKSKGEELVRSALPPVTSCLSRASDNSLSNSMKRAILEVVVSGVASTPEAVDRYAQCTLLAASLEQQTEAQQTSGTIQACIQFLLDSEFITLRKTTAEDGSPQEHYSATQLGSAVLASALSPDEGLAVFTELMKARRCFVLENELHIIYLVTPIYMQNQWPGLEWYQYLCLYEKLSPDMRRVADLVGVKESFLTRAVRGGNVSSKTPAQARNLNIHMRFYTALVLQDLVSEVPLPEVARKYGCSKGVLQSLQQSAATFSGMVTVFCARLGWSSLELLLSQFQSRLTFGVQRELVDLVRVSLLNAHRARALYTGGIQTVAALANAGSHEVERLLNNAVPFQSKKTGEGETAWEAAQRQKTRCIWVSGHKGLTEHEAAVMIIEEARRHLQGDLSQLGLKWTPDKQDKAPEATSNKGNKSLNDSSKALQTSQKHSKGANFTTPLQTSRLRKRRSSSATKQPAGTPHTSLLNASNSVLSPPPGMNSSRSIMQPNRSAGVVSPLALITEPPKTHFEQNSILSPPPAVLNASKKRQFMDKENIEVNCSTPLNAKSGSGSKGKETSRTKCKNSKRTPKDAQNVSMENCTSDNDSFVMLMNKKLKNNKKQVTKVENKPKPSKTCIKGDSGATSPSLDKCAIDDSSKTSCQPVSKKASVENSVSSVSKCSMKRSNKLSTKSAEPDDVIIIDEPDDVIENDKTGSKCDKPSDKPDLLADKQSAVLRESDAQTAQNCSVELYTEAAEEVNMSVDSFVLDTQTLKLMSKHTPTSVLQSKNISKPNLNSPQNEHITPGLNCKLSASDGTPSMYSDTEHDSLTDDFMNNYQTPAMKENQTLASPGLSDKPINEVSLGGMLSRDSSMEMEGNSLDLTNNQDQAVLFSSYMDDEEEQNAPSAPLLPASCFDRVCEPSAGSGYASSNDPAPRTPLGNQLKSLEGTAASSDEHNAVINNLPLQSYQQDYSVKRAQKTSRPDLMKEQKKSPAATKTFPIPGYSNLQEDMMIAMNMSESFSCSILQDDKSTKAPSKLSTRPAEKQDHSQLGDSLTMSVLQRELIDDMEMPSAFLADLVVEKTDKSSKENYTKVKCKGEENTDKVQERATSKTVVTTKSDLVSKNSAKHKNAQFSPDTVAIMDAFCEDFSPRTKKVGRKPPLKATGKSGNTSNASPAQSTSKKTSKPSKRKSTENSNVTPPKVPCVEKPKRRSTAASDNDASLNGSNLSDCVPPTPPKDESTVNNGSRIGTPQRLIGGVVGTPTKNRHKARTPAKSTTNIDSSQSTSVVADLLNASRTLSSSLPCTNQSFTIIDVAAHRRLFEHFVEEWSAQTSYAISVACEKAAPQAVERTVIGANFNKAPAACPPPAVDGFPLPGTDFVITGLAVSWDNRDAYYVALTNNNSQCDLDDSLCPPTLDPDLSVTQRLAKVKAVLELTCGRHADPPEVCGFDAKAQLKALSASCGVWVAGRVLDPKVAAWMLDPADREKNLHRMVHNLLPLEGHLLQGLGGGIGLGSLGLTPDNPGSGRVRSCVEAVLVRPLTDTLRSRLTDHDMLVAYTGVEMPAVVLLARMEMNGIGFSQTQCEAQKSILQAKMTSLEADAYRLAGHQFSLTSTDDIAQVLYVELKLPPSGDPSAPGATTKTLGPARRSARGRAKPAHSTNKDVLEKLKKLHPLPGVILEWRRINGALTKVVFPYQRECTPCVRLAMDRVHGCTQSYTATGRVTMSEPNIQNIPNDFDIDLPGLIGESPPGSSSIYSTRGRHPRPLTAVSTRHTHQGGATAPRDNVPPGPAYNVSMRHAFVPFTGGVMLAADYSQLELRILAHVSGDKKLRNILNTGGDVFKTIAAQWKGVEVADVTAKDRAQAKQVCYGMIYGIGPKALGEQIGVDENEAGAFIETFKAKYTGMRSYLRTTVQQCRRDGYVTTVTRRRRYLPAIKDNNPHAKAHAERQAVNTTIQGSAADLVKTAMVNIDRELWRLYPDTRVTHTHKHASSGRPATPSPRGAFFVLQLHDELIYEVNSADTHQVAAIVRDNMEAAMTLSVKLPVKVKVGPTWGTLEEIQL